MLCPKKEKCFCYQHKYLREYTAKEVIMYFYFFSVSMQKVHNHLKTKEI